MQKQILPKVISILLVFMFVISSMPVALAATPIALKTTHVTEWPTASGEIFFGQMVSEGITISGGKVVYEGVEVPGKFVHWKDEFRPTTASDASKASITFVPDDATSYKGFNKLLSTDVTYKVKKTKAILKSENDLPYASSIKEGQPLSASKITGGEVINPYRADLDLSSIAWEWETPDLVVTESGEYTAVMPLNEDCYEALTMKVYVEVEKDIIGTLIEEKPSFSIEFGQNFVDGVISGGRATANGEDVSGTFDISDYWKKYKAESAGTFDIDIIFTPDDTEKYLPSTTTVTVTVAPIPISFIDSDGNFFVDGYVYEATPGVLMRDVLNSVKKYINYPPQSVFVIEDANSAAQNGRTYKLTVIHDNPNYTGSELYFTVVFKNVELTPTIAFAGYNQYKVDCGRYSPAGTFTITCNGEEIAEAKAGQPFDCVVYTDEGGTYEITAKYNPTENDYFIVSDASYSITVNPARNIKTVSGMHFTVNGSQTYNAIRTGDVIELTYNMPEFAYYVVKDGSGKTVTLEGVDLTSKKIKFTMPDFDLSFSVKTPAQLEQEEATANCDHLCHSDNQFIQLIWKLLHIIFRLFNVQQYCDCGITHYDAPIFG